ncbi:peptidase S41 [Tepiditoga spiralis]|uniref:Peptidase S41 n=1 Tax=Tepiditoga spiralis TaxID=2108365 RepID=A0A7G1GBE0_9BACT|nr:S41 family peptidase [Tepiditoga spiralis]BBE31712.1 peptidase S41 [Tepiditoga spiralis]
MKLKKFLLIFILISAIFFSNYPNNEQYKKSVLNMINIINNKYYGTPNYSKILDSLLNGMIEGLGDKFAWYLDPEKVKKDNEYYSSQYAGIGAMIKYNKEEKVLVVAPMLYSPAEKSGLKVGDKIISLDGSTVSELGWKQAEKKILGKPNTYITLKIKRNTWKNPKAFKIKRSLIKVPTVKYKTFEKNSKKFLYIKLTKFANNSAIEMQKALEKFKDKKFDGFILDLRGNLGGLVRISIDIASMLMKNKVITHIKYSNGYNETKRTISEKYFYFLNNVPKIILVNKNTASSAEILTGAFKDNNAATILGTKTYGKAAIQSTYKFKNGGEIKLPVGHYFTPKNYDINLKGIIPDIIVDYEEKLTSKISEAEKYRALYCTTTNVFLDFKNDLQLNKAIEILSEK